MIISSAINRSNNVKMLSIFRLVVACTLLVLTVSCRTSGGLGDLRSAPPGFTAFPSARSFDPPGQIYRRTPDGEVFRVSTLDVTPTRHPETVATFSGRASWSLQSLLNFNGASGEVADIELTDLTRERSGILKAEAAEREYIQDDSGIDAEVVRVLQSIPIRDGNEYFVIRETIRAGSLQYESSMSWVADIGAQATLSKVFGGSINLGSSGDSSFTIDQDFDTPRRIWYKPEKIKVGRAQSGGAEDFKITYLPVPVDELKITGLEADSP